MKALVKEICETIEEQVERKTDFGNVIVRIEDMPHPQVYSSVCSSLSDLCSRRGYRLIAKLAKPRFNEFLSLPDPLANNSLKYLADHGLVDSDNQMTRWRNHIGNTGEKTLILLMGTEVVEDKGGLYDFYLVNQETLSQRLDHHYSEWFERLCLIEPEDARGVDQILSCIFRHVPEDLFKLSSLIDKMARGECPRTCEELIATLLSRLDEDWGLPRITGVPVEGSCNSITRLIDEAARFRDREGFKEQLSLTHLKAIATKISAYFEKHSDGDLSEVIPGYPNRLLFQADLQDYIMGARLKEVRPKLFACDFSLISEILNLRFKRPAPEKPTKTCGGPLTAIAACIIRMFVETGSSDMEFRFGQAHLADCSTEEELVDAWRRISLVAGGVLRFLSVGLTDNTGNQILNLRVSTGLESCIDPFQPRCTATMVASGKVVRAATSRKLSSVEFSILAGDEEEAFLWEFEPNCGWALDFALLTEDFVTSLNREGTRTLPIWSSPQFFELVQSKSPEEFFDIFDTAEVTCHNVLEHLSRNLPGTENALFIGEVRNLADRFSMFVNALWSQGLYGTMLDIDSGSGVAYVQAYCTLLRNATNGSFTSMVIDQLHALVNAFLICPTGSELDGKGVLAGIVPPIHPAMLEKIQSQAQFMRQGLSEVLQRVAKEHLGANQALGRLEHLVQLSTITSAVDILEHKIAKKYVACGNVFGAYAVYSDIDYQHEGIQRTLARRDGMTQEEEFSASEMLAASPLSRVVSSKILDYAATFPARLDGLRVAFVNPSDLQPIVAGMHKAAKDLSKTASGKLRIRLTILVPSTAVGDRGLLNYWLDHFFEEGDRIEIRTYFRTYDNSAKSFCKSFKELMPSADVTFLHNILETVSIDFEPWHVEASTPNETRFPMVYSPLPVSRTSTHRKSCISQPQFEAARQHSQLIRRLDYEIKGPGLYRVVQELSLSERSIAVMSVAHERSRWVVTTDPGIDRGILRKMNASIIGFSTGEGPFGELNVTVSSTTDVRADIRTRLVDRLRVSFWEMSTSSLVAAADDCLNAASRLDGADVLGALNPDDYDLHNFLAHLLTMKHFEQEHPSSGYLIQALIRLDSHRHWFRTEESYKRPDFLLLEVPFGAADGDLVSIEATLVECKMGHRSEDYLVEAEQQIDHGLDTMSDHWNPGALDTERRYWFAQLYRALVFSNINLPDGSANYVDLVTKLQDIVQGRFEIKWSKKILAFWLDEDNDSDHGQSGLCVELGRRSTWHMILPTSEYPSADPPEATTSQNRKIEQLSNVHRTVELPCPPLSGHEPARVEEPSPSELRLEASPPSELKSSKGVSIVGQSVRVGRLLIGEDTLSHEPVYWEYGHEQLPNRHLLVTGNSGTGKTYFIQAMLLELSRQGVSSVVFDYTDGFTPNKLEKPFVDSLGPKVVQLSVYSNPFPVNPFTRYEIEVAGQFTKQSHIDVAERLKSVFHAVYDLGEQQANAIYNAVKNGLERCGDTMRLTDLRKELESIGAKVPNARTALSKIQPLLDRNPFDAAGHGTWDQFDRSDGTVFIVQLSGLTRDVQLTLTEIILWDAWYHRIRTGDKNKPFPVVLDEAQNLDHSEHSPTARILTEGRKFGWSGWFAAQFLKGQMKNDEIERLQQASQKIVFNPPETELADMASVLEPDHTKVKQWHTRLARLQKGECIVSGFGERSGVFHRLSPRIVRVTSFEGRL